MIWVKTRRGRNIPLDPRTDQAGVLIPLKGVRLAEVGPEAGRRGVDVVTAAEQPGKRTDLPWVTWGQLRCRAYTAEGPYAGRCELRKGHDGVEDHALERGFDTPRWSTRWTA